MNKFSNYLNYIAATILAVVIIGGLSLLFINMCSGDDAIQTIKIEYIQPKNAYTNTIDSASLVKLNKLMSEVKAISNEIQRKQADFVKEKSDKDLYDEIYAAIVAIVIAIAGFFGFKSVNDIKEQAIKDAKIQAEEIASKELKTIFTSQYEAEITAKVTEIIMNKILKDEIEILGKRIERLEGKLNGDEPNEESEQETNNEPKKPF